jgi:hypothetical protein
MFIINAGKPPVSDTTKPTDSIPAATATDPATQTGAPSTQPDLLNKPETRGSAPAANAGMTPLQVEQRLADLEPRSTDPNITAASAASIIRELKGLNFTTSEQLVRAAIIEANAATVTDSTAACRILGKVRQLSQGTSKARTVGTLLENCPTP